MDSELRVAQHKLSVLQLAETLIFLKHVILIVPADENRLHAV